VTVRTLVEPVAARARRDPDRHVLTFIDEGGQREHFNAAQLDRGAAAFAAALAAVGVAPGDLVIVVLRHSPVLLSAFWGALYRGAVPSIFPYLTEKLDPQIYRERIGTLVRHSGARAVITFPEFRGPIEALLHGASCRVLTADDLPLDAARTWEAAPLSTTAESLAFLQHSSGTTGLQKGVALSHRAVLRQIEAYGEAIGLRDDDVVVSWLPLYHDMGLIAGCVMPIVAGIPLVLMSPFHWVRTPGILLSAIHEHRGTLCWLPNFAYNHCALSIRKKDMEGVDLGRLRAVINCSEPVRHESHRRFLDRFTPYGLREEALATCYALAENTFAATQSPIGRPPRVDWVSRRTLRETQRAVPCEASTTEAIAMVSCGIPIPGTQIDIAGPGGARLPERCEGEILLRSDCLLAEYYRRPDATAEALRDGWYHTGDMGYLADGELYVSGRRKDLIIVAGKNLYPQDLEAIADGIPGLRPGRSVAFGVPDENLGTEAIVMVCELEAGEHDRDAIARDLRKRVVQQTEVTLKDVRLVEERWVVKTSSGKTARADNRAKYLEGRVG